MLYRIVIFLAIIAGLTFLFNINDSRTDHVQHVADKTQQKLIAYSIGQIDPRFKLSSEEVLSIAHEATKIWEKGTGESLFIYDPDAILKIHLIYDERQKNSLYVDELNQTMEKKSAELDQMDQRISTQLKDLKTRQTELNDAAEKLRNDQTAWRSLEFEDSVELERIKAQAKYLTEKQQQLSGDFDSYHLNVQLYNQKVADFNQYAQQAREFNFRSPPRLFHKGTFSGDRIDVYQFSSKNDLKVTLAHEFGHALGLSHHQDPKALMYPSMAEQNIARFELLPADLVLFQQRYQAD